jgi:hypothetical protein
MIRQQPSPHEIQWLAHGKLETHRDSARWPPLPESPCSACPSAVSALAAFVDSVLSEHHDHGCKQPHGLLFECRWRDCLISSELTS